MEDGHKAEVFFGVHVHYADGASAEDVLKTYLAPLEIRYEEHEGFSESGVIFLMREQRYTRARKNMHTQQRKIQIRRAYEQHHMV